MMPGTKLSGGWENTLADWYLVYTRLQKAWPLMSAKQKAQVVWWLYSDLIQQEAERVYIAIRSAIYLHLPGHALRENSTEQRR